MLFALALFLVVLTTPWCLASLPTADIDLDLYALVTMTKGILNPYREGGNSWQFCVAILVLLTRKYLLQKNVFFSPKKSKKCVSFVDIILFSR